MAMVYNSRLISQFNVASENFSFDFFFFAKFPIKFSYVEQKARPQSRTTAPRDQNVIQFHIHRNQKTFMNTKNEMYKFHAVS